MTRAVMDVEVYHNLFSIAIKDYDSDENMLYEITERRNDLESIYAFLVSIKYLIGFNSLHYDGVILNYIVKEIDKLRKMSVKEICTKLKRLSDLIISDNDNKNYSLYSRYKWNKPWIDIDLFMYWSKMLRISKKMSLKMFEVNLKWPKVQELPIHHDAHIELGQIGELLDYNMNDTSATKALALTLSKDINLRMAAMKKYGFGTECLSWDGVKLGLKIIVARYAFRTGIPLKDVEQMRTYRTSVDIGSLILPIILFKHSECTNRVFTEDKKLVTEFKSFYGVHEYLRNLVVTSTKDVNCRVMFQGNRYDIKSGGLHTYHNPQVVVPGPNQIYRDIDVSSYYPTEAAKWGFVPEHLGTEAAEELDAMRLERLALKASGQGKSNDANLLKLAMNGGFYGNTNNEYTAMYDMQCMLAITINGQLMLLMLCEKLIDLGVQIDMCNTDGITVLYDKSLQAKVDNTIRAWENLTRMEMESVYYTKVVRMNINNYLAFYEENGKSGVKEKGMFLTNPPIDGSRDAVVIPKAIRAYFEKGTKVEDFINNHDDIYDFCISQKVDKKYTVYWNGQPQQRLNRYYIVRTGPYLYKSEDGEKMTNLMKGYSVHLFNNYEEKSMKEYNINYSYYISEAKKIINELSPSQLSLL
jgi:hypothetical protein